MLESKAAGRKACNFIKKGLKHRRFPKNINKFLRTSFSAEHLRRLLLLNEMSIRAQDNSDKCDVFLNICKDTLDERVPIKRKYLRSNHSSFMNKGIFKVIMNRTRLRNSLRAGLLKTKQLTIKKRNYCVSLVRKIKTDYYNNLDYKKVVDNKSFWKYIKPHFSDKSSNFTKITLVEKDLIIDQNEEIAKNI